MKPPVAGKKLLSEEIHSWLLESREGGRLGEATILVMMGRMARSIEALETRLGRIEPPEPPEQEVAP